jgi:uncharacterized RDD family membrane protein YckC
MIPRKMTATRNPPPPTPETRAFTFPPENLIKDHAPVLTAENLELTYEVAGIGHRFAAALLDHLILVFLLVALWVGASWVMQGLLNINTALNLWIFALIVFLNFLIYNGYFFFFEMLWNGQSPGKRQMGIRVIKEGGYRLDLTSSILRNIIRPIDTLPFFYALGGLLVALTPLHRRLGDIAAGTLVVLDPRPRWTPPR